MPIEAISAARGPEWSLPPLESAPAADGAAAGGFGASLSSAVVSLSRSQEEAASAAQAVASGRATDTAAVVMAVERAQLTMQLASQIRNKSVEAIQDIFHTQI